MSGEFISLAWEYFVPSDDVSYGEVIPVNDDKPHQFGPDCPCNPQWGEDELIHNSFDGREAYETGVRLKH